ncbi:hypothetical protein Ddc_18100 [Ditylenchus destructor]|nr:hypothetical protein Ddc_18100 [Ditylenchus destructor]
MRGPEARPATILETLNHFLAEAMAVALYEYREGSPGHPRHSSRRPFGTAEANALFSAPLVRPVLILADPRRDAQLSGLCTRRGDRTLDGLCGRPMVLATKPLVYIVIVLT